MLSKVRQGIVELGNQQILTIIQPGNRLFHAVHFTALADRQPPSDHFCVSPAKLQYAMKQRADGIATGGSRRSRSMTPRRMTGPKSEMGRGTSLTRVGFWRMKESGDETSCFGTLDGITASPLIPRNACLATLNCTNGWSAY